MPEQSGEICTMTTTLVFAKPNGCSQAAGAHLRELWTSCCGAPSMPHIRFPRSAAHSGNQHAPADRGLLHGRADPGAQPEGDRHPAPALQQPGGRHRAVCRCADGARSYYVLNTYHQAVPGCRRQNKTRERCAPTAQAVARTSARAAAPQRCESLFVTLCRYCEQAHVF